MSADTVQLRLVISPELHIYLKKKANSFGVPISTYIKLLLINDVKSSFALPADTPPASLTPAQQRLRIIRQKYPTVTDLWFAMSSGEITLDEEIAARAELEKEEREKELFLKDALKN